MCVLFVKPLEVMALYEWMMLFGLVSTWLAGFGDFVVSVGLVNWGSAGWIRGRSMLFQPRGSCAKRGGIDSALTAV